MTTPNLLVEEQRALDETVIRRNKDLAREWEIDAARRQEIWRDDPVAAAFEYCSRRLLDWTKNLETSLLEDTVEDYARSRGITTATVRRWCRQKHLAARLTPKGWMILRHQPTPSRQLQRVK